MKKLHALLIALVLIAPAFGMSVIVPGPGGVSGAFTPIGTPVALGTATATSGATSMIITLGSASPAGAAVVVGYSRDHNPGSSGLISTVTDTNASSYTVVTAANGVTAQGVAQIAVCLNCPALSSGNTITINFATAVAPGRGAQGSAASVTGVLSSGAVDTTTSSTATTATPTVATGTLAQANEIIFGADGFTTTGQTYTASTSSAFTQIGATVDSGFSELGFAYRINLSGTGTVTNAPTWSGGANQAPQSLVSLKGF